MGRLVAILLICRFEGYFHLGKPVIFFTTLEEVKAKLEAWSQDKPLPIIVYKKYTKDPLPEFRDALSEAVKPGNGWGAYYCIIRSELTKAILREGQPYVAWTPKDKPLEKHLKDMEGAMKISNELTRWLRGGRGWTTGPKPDIAVHDILIGFKPEWKRKPLTPELVRKL
jgi:hypothetical protein